MNNKSKCCSAIANFNNIHVYWWCAKCRKNCELQKNDDLTLAEIYAEKDDVITFSSPTSSDYARDILFEEDKYQWSLEEIFEYRYKILDRKSWHKEEEKEVKSVQNPEGAKDKECSVTQEININKTYIDKILNDQILELKKEVENLKAQLEAEHKKSEWLPYPENKPSKEDYVIIKDKEGSSSLLFTIVVMFLSFAHMLLI